MNASINDGGRAGRQDVEVAARFAAAAQAADRSNVGVGSVLAQAATSAAAVSCASGISRRPARRCALLERLEDQRLLLRAHPLSARMRPSLAARSRSSSVRMSRLAVERAPRSWARRPAGAAGRGSSAGNSCQQFLVIPAGAGLDELADLARRGLCRCPGCRAVRAARARRPVAEMWRRCRRRCGTREF